MKPISLNFTRRTPPKTTRVKHGLYKHHTTLILVLYTTAIFSGCRCQDEENTVPHKNQESAFRYWPKDSGFQWVFKVSETDGRNTHYLYDDTLVFVKDSNILSKGELNFQVFQFKKGWSLSQFVIGVYPSSIDRLFLCMDGVNYTLFDLSKFTQSLPATNIKTNGKPIDDRYEMSYTNMTVPLSFPIGQFNCIASGYSFFQVYPPSGSESRNVNMLFAEHKGPVIFEYLYSVKGIPGVNDSSSRRVYEIKEIIR